MKRILGLGLFLARFSLPLLAAKNSGTFLLPSDVRVGMQDHMYRTIPIGGSVDNQNRKQQDGNHSCAPD